MKRRATADKATPTWLRLREIHGHVTVTDDTLTAWFVLSPQRWSFTTDGQRESLINAFTRGLANLAGHRVHLRPTTRPYPARDWAEALHANTPDPVGGRTGEVWTQHLVDAQNALNKSTLSEKVVYLGIDLKTRTKFNRLLGGMRGMDGALAEINKHEETLSRFADIVAGPGLDGRPARTDEIEWLVHRSVRLGLPAPTSLSTDPESSWALEDMHAFTDGVDHVYEKFGPTVEIKADYEGKTIAKHVAVLAVGRMGALDIPQTHRDPWLHALDRFGAYGVESYSVFDVMSREETAKATEKWRLLIRSQQKHYAEHGIEEPLGLDGKADLAKRIEWETNEGDEIEASRAYGWHRIAVSGDTERECLKRVEEIKAFYARQGITIEHPRRFHDAAAQFPMYLEFIPGEKVSTNAYIRRLKTAQVAAGLPHATARVGDNRGFLMGYTTGSARRAFMFDPWYAMEVQEKSGLVPVSGEQGSGKSGFIGKTVYESAVAGNITTAIEPASRLQALCDTPALRNHSRHLDLVDGIDGSLSPYAVVTNPVREFYESEEKWQEAVQIARMGRKMLATDITRQLLPVQVDRMDRTPLLLSEAIRRVDPVRTSSLWDVVHALEGVAYDKDEPHARDMAHYLRDMAEMPKSRLFYGNNVHDEEEYTDTLLIITMHGLTLPETERREDWTVEEQMSVPLLNLASHYATRRIYDLPPSDRKMIAFDEVGIMRRWASGRALFTQAGRNSRKWNLAALLGSQNPSDIDGLSIANFISTTFVGRIEDEDIAAEALRQLRIKPGVGYERVLAGLSPQVALSEGNKRRGAREFLVKDVFGNVEKVRLDYSHQPDLLAALAKGSVEARQEVAA